MRGQNGGGGAKHGGAQSGAALARERRAGLRRREQDRCVFTSGGTEERGSQARGRARAVDGRPVSSGVALSQVGGVVGS